MNIAVGDWFGIMSLRIQKKILTEGISNNSHTDNIYYMSLKRKAITKTSIF